MEVVVYGSGALADEPGAVFVLSVHQELYPALIDLVSNGKVSSDMQRVERLSRGIGIALQIGELRPASVFTLARAEFGGAL